MDSGLHGAIIDPRYSKYLETFGANTTEEGIAVSDG